MFYIDNKTSRNKDIYRMKPEIKLLRKKYACILLPSRLNLLILPVEYSSYE
jgi:hypothetical protein